MKLTTLLALLLHALVFLPTSSLAQVNTLQSINDVKWQEIESKNFKIVFPRQLEDKAQYTLNLLEHYKPLVSKSYEVNSKKLLLVIRPDMALPNGFVTLAPRRSEWFNNTSLTPLVGSLEWFQSLAIHEYRHVVQYDYLNQGYTRWGYNLFGEGVLGLLINMVMPTWYFEGDAVWAETVLSDGGRGRSPRFSSRLKALISSNNFPKYDELLARSYTKNLPNYYVYGFFLITRAYQVYGPNVWKEIAAYAADHPWNAYAMYNGFQYVTNQSFETFYNETLQELKSKWGELPKKDYKKFANKKNKNKFSQQAYPMKKGMDLFYLERGLNSHWGLHSAKKGLIKELNIIPSLSKVDMTKSKFLFVQNSPHWRYSFKEFSNLYIYDLKKNQTKKLTHNKRLFHPQFSRSGKKILAIEYNDEEEVSLNIYDLKGELISEHSLSVHKLQFAQATWISNSEIVAIVIDNEGKKFFASYDLMSDDLEQLTPSTRNNIYNISYNNGFIYYEADYKGKVNIFRYHIKDNRNSQCSDEFIGAFSPSVNKSLYYVYESDNGRVIRKKSLSCKSIRIATLFNQKTYLSKSPSDFYHKSRPLPLNKFTKFQTTTVKSKRHSEFSGLLTPHSWSFLGGRGLQLNATTTNNLNSLGLNAYLGTSSEESTPFVGLGISFLKLYPIFTLQFDFAKREKEIIEGQTSTWEEATKSINMVIPFNYSNNLWKNTSQLSINSGIITLSKNDYTVVDKLNDNGILTNSIGLSSTFYKSQTLQELQPKYAFSLNLKYTDLKTIEDAEINYLAQLKLGLNLPSYFDNHGFNFEYTQENRPENESLYQLQSNYVPVAGYTFSRGYAYEFTSEFKKVTIEYLLPLSYLNKGYKEWIFIPQIYAKAFFDSTSFLNDVLENEKLDSKGFELFFETNTFRKFSLTYGLRFYKKETDQSEHGEIFLATIIN